MAYVLALMAQYVVMFKPAMSVSVACGQCGWRRGVNVSSETTACLPCLRFYLNEGVMTAYTGAFVLLTYVIMTVVCCRNGDIDVVYSPW